MKKRKNIKKIKFELAEQDGVQKLQPYIDKIIKALGHGCCLVTDESYISDFLSFIHHEPLRTTLRKKELERARKKLKIKISENELVIDVAKRLMKGKGKMGKYIIIWTPASEKHSILYQGKGNGTTYNKKEARVFTNKKEAGMSALKMCQIGWIGPSVVLKD